MSNLLDNFFTSIEVGRPFPPSIGKPEGTQLHISPAPCNNLVEFIINFQKPTKAEIRDFREGTIKVRLFEDEGLLFLLVKMGDQNWFDVPFEPRLHDSFELDAMPPSYGYPMLTILCDVPSGIVVSIRQTAWTSEFSNIFKTAVDSLNSNREGFSAEEYCSRVAEYQNNHSCDEMASRAKIGFEYN